MTSTRRTLLRRTVAAAVLTGTAGLTTHLIRSTPAAADTVETFDETRHGRALSGRGGAHPELLIDGVALHVMRNADGRYSTAMNHYEAFATLREAAYAAVDALHGAALRPAHVHTRRVVR